MDLPTVKILVCCHKPYSCLSSQVFSPIHIGRAQADPKTKLAMGSYLRDDQGENISHKNPSYAELTAQYWAWKNFDALGNPDYIGFFHYRRYLQMTPTGSKVRRFYGLSKRHSIAMDGQTVKSGVHVLLPMPSAFPAISTETASTISMKPME